MSIINILFVISGNWNSEVLWSAVVLGNFAIYIILIPRFVGKSTSYLGLANWVTISRLILVLVLFANYSALSKTTLFIGFTVAILFDGLDGMIARRFNESSIVGGNLDMEVDSFLVLAISWVHYDQSNIGWWVLIPGSLKYFYQLLFSWSKVEEDFFSKKVRATIAVIFFLSLSLTFILPDPYGFSVLLVSSILICFSFAGSMYLDIKSIRL